MSTSGADALQLHVHIEADETGKYIAQVRELPGCVAQGSTQSEALERLTEVIPVYLSVAFDRVTPREVTGTSSSGGTHGGTKSDFVLAFA